MVGFLSGKVSRWFQWRQKSQYSIAIVVQGCSDRFFHAGIDGFGAAQIASLLFAQTASQVAGAALPVHAFPLGG